jgi:uncharacterized membrane protein
VNDDELHRLANRGDRAKALLDNTLLNEAFDRVDAECVRLWGEALTTEAREGFWLRRQALKHVRTAIEAVVKDGDIARRKLKQAIEGKKSVF